MTPSENATVRGNASYRERIALPPGAVLEVALEDVSLADAPSKVLGSVRVEDPGNPPFAFEIPYDPKAIDDRHSYAVRAAIRVGDKLMFTTDTAYPVLTRDAGNEVEVLMVRAARGRQASAPALEGTHWMLTELAGQPAPALEGDREPHIILRPEDGAVGGTGGCNRISGAYAVDGASISFGQLAVTNRACIDDADVDRELAAALERASSCRQAGGQLELLDADGNVLARFEAAKSA